MFKSDPQTTQTGILLTEKEAAEIAEKIHYPRCWDTAAYPTLAHAVFEIASNAGCSEHPSSEHSEEDIAPFREHWDHG